jgi:pantetheine-phosphate adenylyltransferase
MPAGRLDQAPVTLPYNGTTVRALFPGSFDPVTTGHLDVIVRGAALFDELWVGIGRNSAKRPLFSVEERLEQLGAVVAAAAVRVRVVAFGGLVVEYARANAIGCLLRGVRGGSDLDYEVPMAQLNRRLAPEVDTLFLAPAPEHAFVSGRLIRDAGRHGGNLAGLVPECIRVAVERRLKEERSNV